MKNGSPSKMYNVDRWFYYSKQRLRLSSYSMSLYARNWPNVTPAQAKRMRKHHRRGDYSLGMGN